MTVETVGVCPLAQGWDEDIAKGDVFNYRLLVGFASGAASAAIEWYVNQVTEVFLAMLEHYAGAATEDWILFQTKWDDRNLALEVYCRDLTWLIQFKLTDHRPDEILGHIRTIEERIRAV